MKVGIFSDPHLGFNEKGERCEESYDNLKQAIDLCISEGVDFCILAGDVFDEPVPSHNSLFKSIECFSPAKKNVCGVSLFLEKNSETKSLPVSGLPILTIHGNHEFRGKDTRSALDVLNLSGLLVYFHAGKIAVEKNGEKIFVFGLGAVPEKRAKDVLQYWNPRPVEGASNILLLHQGFSDFMAIEDDMVATLSLSDLPKGFDLIVNGHLHWANEQKLGDSIFLLPGSTISTSIKKLESEKPKGIFLYDSNSRGLSFRAFPRQRKMFYKKIVFKGADSEEVEKTCRLALESCCVADGSMKPLVRLNLKGTIKKGLSPGDINLSALLEKFSGKAIISLSKNFSGDSFRAKISELRDIQNSRLSVASLGFDLLEKNLEQSNVADFFSPKELFELLSEDNIDAALEKISKG